jgi:hypothetical protein
MHLDYWQSSNFPDSRPWGVCLEANFPRYFVCFRPSREKLGMRYLFRTDLQPAGTPHKPACRRSTITEPISSLSALHEIARMRLRHGTTSCSKLKVNSKHTIILQHTNSLITENYMLKALIYQDVLFYLAAKPLALEGIYEIHECVLWPHAEDLFLERVM